MIIKGFFHILLIFFLQILFLSAAARRVRLRGYVNPLANHTAAVPLHPLCDNLSRAKLEGFDTPSYNGIAMGLFVFYPLFTT